MGFLLDASNYKSGFLVDDEVIAGVTEMGDAARPLYAAYVSHYLTGETYAYREFERVEPALEFLATIERKWAFEGVGCTAKASATSCSTGGSCSKCSC
ncbi:MAG: hypothetical protein HY075_08380 [Deltaproteobacteria bacterium]|nr:hypothetical protein [Deltaproteobacteria bacterium]